MSKYLASNLLYCSLLIGLIQSREVALSKRLRKKKRKSQFFFLFIFAKICRSLITTAPWLTLLPLPFACYQKDL